MLFLKLLLKALPLFFWLLLMLSFDAPYLTVLTLIAAALHELGHIAASEIFLGRRSGAPYAVLSGFRIKTAAGLSYKEEIFVAALGPLTNLVVGAAFIFSSLEYAKIFAIVNFLTAASNLMPINSYDGYRILDSVLAILFNDAAKAQKILHSISFAFSICATFLSLYLILKISEGYWIFAIFFSVVISEIIKRQKHTFF